MKKILFILPILSFLIPSISGQDVSSFTLGKPNGGGQTVINSDTLTLESTDYLSKFTFTGHVEVHATNLFASCEKMLVVSRRSGDADATVGQMGKIEKIIAIGKVRIEQGDRVALAGKAEILPNENKVVLEDNPTVIDGGSTVRGYRMILLKGQRKAIVEGADGSRPTVTLPMINDLGF
jgi:lipopolysaccharide export system protein LptA